MRVSMWASKIRVLIIIIIVITSISCTVYAQYDTLSVLSDIEVGTYDPLWPPDPRKGRAQQGIAAHENKFYTSVGIASVEELLFRYDPSWGENNIVAEHEVTFDNPLGISFTHVGDIDVYNDHVYGVFTDNSWIPGTDLGEIYIAWFDAESLEYEGHIDMSWIIAGFEDLDDISGLAFRDDQLYILGYETDETSYGRIFVREMNGNVPGDFAPGSAIDTYYANGLAFKGDYMFISWGSDDSIAFIDIYKLPLTALAVPIKTYQYEAIYTHAEGITFNDDELWVAQGTHVLQLENPLRSITASSGLHGSIDPTGVVYVVKGANAIFTATPESGYVVDRWFVDGEDRGGGVSSLTLENVQFDRTVLVTFKAENSPPSDLVIERPAANPYTTGDSSVQFSGTAPSNTHRVTWENQTTNNSGDTDSPPGTTWSDRIYVDEGSNTIVFRAYDDSNRLLAEASTVVIRVDNIVQVETGDSGNCWIASGTPTRNYSDGVVYVGCDPESTHNERGLISFNLPSLPAGSTYSSAIFSAQTSNGFNTGSGALSISVRRITSSWNYAAVTWNSTPGNTTQDQALQNVGDYSNTRFDWDITGIAERWYSGSSNYGLMMISNSEDSGYQFERVFNEGKFKLFINYETETENPQVQITIPTTSDTYYTNATSITLGGIASDNTQIDRVTYSNQTTGENGTATGTTSWTCSVNLIAGLNTIAVTAFDAVNNSDNDTIRVTYLTIPSGVIATDDLLDYILVEWYPVTAAGYYQVYRSQSEAGAKTALSNWTDSLSFMDNTAEPETTYYYWVKAAVDDSGTGASDFSGYDTGFRVPVPTYTLTTSVIGGNGTISSGGTHNSGEVITLTATPDSGYKVKAWSGTDNDSSTATTNTVTMNEDKAVSVEYELISPPYSGGTGTEADPYKISTAQDIIDISSFSDYDKHFVMINDVDFSSHIFTTAVIAPDTSATIYYQGTSFTGTFDGNGHEVVNLAIDSAGADNDYLGLFGQISSTALVRNVHIVGCSVKGDDFIAGLAGDNLGGSVDNCYVSGVVHGYEYSSYVGGLIGWNRGEISNSFSTVAVTNLGSNAIGGLVGANNGTINKCSSTGNVTGHQDKVGGLAGRNIGGNIRNSFATGAVNGIGLIGGLVGENEGGTISYCFSIGQVTGNNYVGGLVGASENGGNIHDSYAQNDVTGNSYIAGLLGGIHETTVERCYSSGTISGSEYLGGLVALNFDNTGSIDVSFWNTEISGLTTSQGGTGKNTAELQAASTFVDAGWDFSDGDGDPADWQMPAMYYPILAWEDGSVLVPNIIGMSQSDAKDHIISERLIVGSTTIDYTSTEPPEQVINQSPTAGSSVVIGSSVDMVISATLCDFCGASFGPPDGYVDVWDLMQFADHWHVRTGEGNWDATFDLAGPNFGDPDGYVDVWDLMVFADHWHDGEKP